LGDHIKTNKRGVACGTYRGQERYIRGCSGGYLREIDHLQDLGVDRRTISEWVFKKGVGVAWTGLLWLRLGTGGGRL
jgi:hypothetical protein